MKTQTTKHGRAYRCTADHNGRRIVAIAGTAAEARAIAWRLLCAAMAGGAP